MEAAPVTLSDDEVRERFSAFHDGELPPDEAAAVRARLEGSPALTKEYDRFRAVLVGLSGMGSDAAAMPTVPGKSVEPAPVNLLAGVQKRLHKRSGGRFFRSRYARIAGIVPIEAFAAVVLVLLVVLYVCLTYISGLRAAEPSHTPATHAAP